MVYFFILAFVKNRFEEIVLENSDNKHEVLKNSLYYLLEVSIFSFFLTSIFSIPIYLSIKVKKRIYFVLVAIAVLLIEYFGYTYLASPSDFIIGIYNGILTLILFFILRFIEFRKFPSPTHI
jgi:hypothetical protein